MSLNRITMIRGDARNFRPGMTVHVDGELARIRAVNYMAGVMEIHRPWWWRAKLWALRTLKVPR